eukprot:4784888-Pyramimonas_sp.AAC.1
MRPKEIESLSSFSLAFSEASFAAPGFLTDGGVPVIIEEAPRLWSLAPDGSGPASSPMEPRAAPAGTEPGTWMALSNADLGGLVSSVFGPSDAGPCDAPTSPGGSAAAPPPSSTLPSAMASFPVGAAGGVGS